MVSSVEALPTELSGLAAELRIQFPWGSLLSAILRADRQILVGLADLLKPGGTLTLLVSITERDGVELVERLDGNRAPQMARRIAAAGSLVCDRYRIATPTDISASCSTWAKRLGVGRTRTAWLFEFRKPN